jgi:predicted RNase H-like nuclease (RuvC/YqgF family)
MREPVESLIEKFQNACLAKLEDVQRTACAEVERVEAERAALSEGLAAQKVAFSRELAERDAKILQLTANIDRLVAWPSRTAPRPAVGNVEQNERVSLLTKQVTEKDARISNLLTLLGERDSALAANDPEPVDETIASLQAEIVSLKGAIDDLLAKAEEEEAAHEKEIDELRSEVKELEEQLEEKTPDADALADAVHGFLRSERLLPSNLDVPMSIVSAVYRDGLALAVGSELP